MLLIWALIELVVSSLFALVAAVAMARRYRTEMRALDALTVIALWCVIVTFLVWLLGVCGLLRPHLVTGLAMIGLVGLLSRACTRADCRMWLSYARAAIGHRAHARPLVFTVFLVATIFLVLRMLAHTWYLPPYVYDVLTYHLPKVADWIQTGHLVSHDSPVLRSFWPAGFELLQAWFCLFVHHDMIVELAGLPFYALGVGAVAVIARSLGLSSTASIGAAMVYAFTPAVLQNAVSCKNDVAICGLFLYSLALLCNAVRQPGRLYERGVLVIMAVTFGIGIKPTMLMQMPGLLFAAGWVLWCRWRAPCTTDFRIGVSLQDVFLLAGTLICTSFWYLRNFARFGNPLYPTPHALFSQTSWVAGDAGTQQGTFSWTSLWTNITNIATERIRDTVMPFNPELGGLSGWGWFVFGCGIPAGILALVAWKSFRPFAVAMLLAAAGLLGSVNPDPWNMRFMLWFPAVFAVAFAGLLGLIPFRSIRDLLIVLATACCLMNAGGTLDTGYYGVKEWLSRIRTPAMSRAIWAGQEGALSVVSDDVPLGYHVHANHWVYPLYGPDLRRRIVYINPVDGDTFSEAMVRSGVRHLFIPPSSPQYNRFMDERNDAMFATLGHNVFMLKETGPGSDG